MTGYASVAYGLDHSPRGLVLARAVRRAPPQVLYSGPSDVPEILQLLEKVNQEVESGSAVLAVACPAAQTVVRPLSAPFASATKAARIWPSLLDVALPFPVESAVCAFGPARVDAGRTHTIAAALRKTDLAVMDDAGKARGVQTTHADVEALALWDSLVAEIPPVRPDPARMLVWLGADHVMVVRGRGTEFIAAHVLRANPLQATGDESEFAEIWPSRFARIVETHRKEHGPTEADVWWGGPGTGNRDLLDRLRQVPTPGLTLRHETLDQPESWLARALARRALSDTGMNFKTGERTHPAVARVLARRQRRRYTAVAVTATAVLLLNSIESFWRQRSDVEVQRLLQAEASAFVGGFVPPGQERLLVARAVERRDEQARPFRVALDPSGLEGELDRVVRLVATADLDVSRLTLSPLALSLEGTASGIAAVEQLADQLGRRGWVVQSDTPGITPEGRPRFILKGARQHDG